jgi:hypothetical protein
MGNEQSEYVGENYGHKGYPIFTFSAYEFKKKKKEEFQQVMSIYYIYMYATAQFPRYSFLTVFTTLIKSHH